MVLNERRARCPWGITLPSPILGITRSDGIIFLPTFLAVHLRAASTRRSQRLGEQKNDRCGLYALIGPKIHGR